MLDVLELVSSHTYVVVSRPSGESPDGRNVVSPGQVLKVSSILFYAILLFPPDYGQAHETGITNVLSLQGVALLILINLLIPTCSVVSTSA